MYTNKGRPVREKTALYGVGLRYKVHYYDPDGKERNQSFPDKAKTKADNFLTKMQHDVLSDDYVDPKAGDELFRTYTKQWMKGQSADASTRQTVESRLKNGVYPMLGDKSLRVAGRVDTIRDWMEWMERPVSEGGKCYLASYRAQLFDLVSAILNSACDDKKIKKNPCAAKSIKRPKKDGRKIVPWPEERVHAVKNALPGPYKIAVPLGAGAGLRQMEIFGFSPDDVDRKRSVLNIQRQIRWIGRVPVFAPPKGGKTREVPAGAGLLDEIEAHQAEFEPVEVTLPWLEPKGRPETVRLLINRQRLRLARTATNPFDVVSGAAFATRAWPKAFADAGLVYVPRIDSMHGLRHFFASIMLANGVSIKELAEYLGHHDPGFTLRIYTHLVPSSHTRARAACDMIFTPAAASEPEALAA
ncbi:site-specific integrase [Amycolatopsis minnesotensis]|uniref:tyrosine-type recombinase/integrase n=1 Tax=Amycolatopsis minnesotensis TaxID=337894 RepID=UPI0031E0ABAA